MTKTHGRQSALPLYQKLLLLNFNNIAKMQLAKTMHLVHKNKISNLHFHLSRVENFHKCHTRNAKDKLRANFS